MKTKLLLSGLLFPLKRDFVSANWRILNFCLFSFVFLNLSSQVPQGFNYQALATDASGNPVRNTDLQVGISILSDTTLPVTVWEELHPAIRTNAHGIFSLVIGSGIRQSVSTVTTFNEINWIVPKLFLRTRIYYQGAWKNMGSAKLWTVPYSMVAGELGGSLDKLEVAGKTTSLEEALFEVKNKDGQIVFAVYNEGVRIYVDNATKSPKGGFAIGGFGLDKADSQKYLWVTGDSIRMYLDSNPDTKVKKGGFAIGGFDMTKGIIQNYLDVSADSIRMYIDKSSGKTRKGGFAIGGFDLTKQVTNEEYFHVTRDSTRIYVNDGLGKSKKGGFSIGGFNMTKGIPTIIPFTSLTPDNYFIGQKSGIKNTTGIHNSFVGYETGINNTSGRKNVFLGYHAGMSNDTASFNVFIGNEAGKTNNFGRYNTFLGYRTGYSNSTGQSNAFMGYNAGYLNQSGSNNVYVGNLAGFSGTYVNSNVSLGDSAGYGNTSSFNVFIGKGSGKMNEGEFSTFVGYQTGLKNSSGPNNVFIGYQTGYSNTTGGFNSFVGKSAGFNNTTGWSNVFIGTQAGYLNTSGSNNILIGESSGYSLKTGRYNLFLGDWSGKWNIDGNNNIFLGAMSGQYNIGSTNIMIGYLCGINSVNGSDNIFIGKNTGRSCSGSNNLFIGSEAGNSASGSNNLFIGTGAGITETTGSNKLYIDNSGTSTPLIGGDFTNDRVGINRMPTTYALEVGGTIWANGTSIVAGSATWSDARYKTDITPIAGALSDILKIQGVNYYWRQTEYPDLNFPKGEQIGVIAQDIEKILPEIVYTATDGYKSVSYEKLTPVLIEAIKEQQQLIEKQQVEINHLKSLENEVSELKFLVNSLLANQTTQVNK